MTAIVLVSSPLVGAGAMQGLAEQLRSSGRSVLTPQVPFDLAAFSACVADACGEADDAPVVVAFSAAGPRMYHLASVADLAAIVFLDARLPDDGVAPDSEPAFAELLDALPRDDAGTLPPWPTWWPTEVMERLVPDDEQRAALIAGCDRPPRAMFSTPIPAPPVDVPCAFVGLGTGYATDADEARRRGWPVASIEDADHLWPVTHPSDVAEVLIRLIEQVAP